MCNSACMRQLSLHETFQHRSCLNESVSKFKSIKHVSLILFLTRYIIFCYLKNSLKHKHIHIVCGLKPIAKITKVFLSSCDKKFHPAAHSDYSSKRPSKIPLCTSKYVRVCARTCVLGRLLAAFLRSRAAERAVAPLH